uniref:Uncharacterized protein n=1 Tax=Heterorhabditis bacteriophora TaxID=37862 RepID=A0A1I7XES5_HETBA
MEEPLPHLLQNSSYHQRPS